MNSSFVGRSVPWIICCNAACLGSSEQQEELRNIQDNRPDREFCLRYPRESEYPARLPGRPKVGGVDVTGALRRRVVPGAPGDITTWASAAEVAVMGE